MSTPLRVIKLGGSLVDWTELPARFESWLTEQPQASNVVVVGGGRLVDVLRQIDRTLGLPVETVHWAAVRAMDVMAELLAARIRGAIVARDFGSLDRRHATGVQVQCVESFLRADAKSRDALPCGWHVTSDSIAARMARVLEAYELVLLKSTIPDPPPSIEAWQAAGVVDRYFGTAACGLLVRLVNLRDDRFGEARCS